MANKHELEKIPLREKFIATSVFNEKCRAKREDEDHVFVFAEGKSRYGRRYSTDEFCRSFEIKETPQDVWEKNVRRIVKLLAKSGLWAELLEIFQNLEKMSYSDFCEISKIYYAIPYIKGEDRGERTERIKNALNSYITKYPWIITENGINTDYLRGGLAEAKLKSMYFGKGCNHLAKREIADALLNRRKYSTRGYASYDVSFSYDPEKEKAYYSEEYRGCGNGHYYIALDGNTALFCEDD